jgi:hypothetical protein
MLQAPQNLRDVAVLSCAYHFKVKGVSCFILILASQDIGLLVN